MNASRALVDAEPPASTARPASAEPRPTARRAENVTELARPFVGEFKRRPNDSGALLDFEQLELRADGSYQAKVDATLLNAGVRSFGARCTLAEEGGWNVYEVSGSARLRIRPTTGRARVYCVTLSDGELVMARRGERTTLFALVERSVRCAS